MSYLKKNVQALQKNLPALAKDLQHFTSSYLGKSEVIKQPSFLIPLPLDNGQISAKIVQYQKDSVDEVWIHSRYDPMAEASKLARAALQGGEDTALVLGFGMGYLVQACFDAGAHRVIVAEERMDFFLTSLQSRDLSEVLTMQGLSFLIGTSPDIMPVILDECGAKKVVIIPARAHSTQSWYKGIQEWVSRWKAKKYVNINTLKKFGHLWVRNAVRNVEKSNNAGSLASLLGLMQGGTIPALVVAAGPSLDEVLPFLELLKDRCVIICVDTALRSILPVEPDFIVLMDPQYWNWRHIAGLASPSSILVTEGTVWPRVLDMHTRSLIFSASKIPLGKKLDNCAGRQYSLGAGGSVATSAWDLARLLGCCEVFFAGLDLGYPDGKVYAKASLFNSSCLHTGTRLLPSETYLAKPLCTSTCFAARTLGGGKTYSDSNLNLYAWWFEHWLQKPNSPLTYSLNLNSLAIRGMKYEKIQTLLGRSKRRYEIDTRINSFIHDTDKRKHIQNQDSRTFIQELIHNLESALILLEEMNARKKIADTVHLNICKEKLQKLQDVDIATFLAPIQTGDDCTRARYYEKCVESTLYTLAELKKVF